jgi:hypothetical protein
MTVSLRESIGLYLNERHIWSVLPTAADCNHKVCHTCKTGLRLPEVFNSLQTNVGQSECHLGFRGNKYSSFEWKEISNALFSLSIPVLILMSIYCRYKRTVDKYTQYGNYTDVASTSTLYLRGTWFNSRPEGQLYCLRCFEMYFTTYKLAHDALK